MDSAPLHLVMALLPHQYSQLCAGISSRSLGRCHSELIKAVVRGQVFKGRFFTPVTFSKQAPPSSAHGCLLNNMVALISSLRMCLAQWF